MGKTFRREKSFKPRKKRLNNNSNNYKSQSYTNSSYYEDDYVEENKNAKKLRVEELPNLKE